MNNSKIITIDGPSGVGKGTLSKKLASYLNYKILDSGAIYRLAALHCKNSCVNTDSLDEILAALKDMNISFKIEDNTIKTFLNDIDVSLDIRTEEIGMLASKVSPYPEVRAALLDIQKNFATEQGLVADGRDMGTVVFPDAQYKFFLEANSEVRAQRRYDELLEKGENPNFEQIKNDIEQRDFQDRNRKTSPLKPADDAVTIDTSNLSIDKVFETVLERVYK